MARYFFDIVANEREQADQIGFECDTLDQMRSEAMRSLPEIASAELPLDGDHQKFTVLVSDCDRKPVFTATLLFTARWLD